MQPMRKPPAVVRMHDPRDPTGRRIIEVEVEGRPVVIPHAPSPDSRLADPVHRHVPAR